MARVAHVLVVLGGAGEGEGVVASDRVAHDLHERVHVDVVELPLEARLRVRLAHEAPRRRRIEAALEPSLQLLSVKGQEVRALLPLHVDHLDELARSHLVRERGRGVDADVEAGLGEGWRELVLLVGARSGPSHLDEELGGGRCAVDDSPTRGGDHHRHRTVRSECLRRAGRRPLAEEAHGRRLSRIEAACGELLPEQGAVTIA